MNRTITVYLAVLPWDYTTAYAEVFESRVEAEAFLKEWDVKGGGYGVILERPIVCE